MTGTWMLVVKRIDDGSGYFLCSCSSSESAKREAKLCQLDREAPNLLAEIVAPGGEVMFHARLRRAGSWRIRWHWGPSPPEPADG